MHQCAYHFISYKSNFLLWIPNHNDNNAMDNYPWWPRCSTLALVSHNIEPRWCSHTQRPDAASNYTHSQPVQHQQTLPTSMVQISSPSSPLRCLFTRQAWHDEGPVCGPGLSECQAQAQAAHSTLGPHTALRSRISVERRSWWAMSREYQQWHNSWDYWGRGRAQNW